jgi:hypothetical protein
VIVLVGRLNDGFGDVNGADDLEQFPVASDPH